MKLRVEKSNILKNWQIDLKHKLSYKIHPWACYAILNLGEKLFADSCKILW